MGISDKEPKSRRRKSVAVRGGKGFAKSSYPQKLNRYKTLGGKHPQSVTNKSKSRGNNFNFDQNASPSSKKRPS